MNMSRVGPGRKACDNVELSEKATDHLIGVSRGAESIQLRHHLGQGALDIRNGALGVVFALLFETALTLGKFFSVEIGSGMERGIALRAGVGQEA